MFQSSLGVESKRINKEEYLHLNVDISTVLANYFDKYHTIKAFRFKKDYGDIDIVVTNPKVELSQKFLKEQLKEELKASHVSQNSEIISYLINGFQLDLIICPPENYDTSICYFDYDPAGNLAGKIAHRFGLRLGHDGLTYILREDNVIKLGKIIVSKNWADICDFLDFDYDQWSVGFDTQEQIFEWIIKSKYFDARIFSFENMNHIARVRDRKRQSYGKFLKYIEQCSDRIYDWPLYKEDNLPLINSFFPDCHLIEKIDKLNKEHEIKKQLKSKFNGTLVMEWTGVTGKELGVLLEEYKNLHNTKNYTMWESFDNFIEYNPPEDIKEDFMRFFKTK